MAAKLIDRGGAVAFVRVGVAAAMVLLMLSRWVRHMRCLQTSAPPMLKAGIGDGGRDSDGGMIRDAALGFEAESVSAIASTRFSEVGDAGDLNALNGGADGDVDGDSNGDSTSSTAAKLLGSDRCGARRCVGAMGRESLGVIGNGIWRRRGSWNACGPTACGGLRVAWVGRGGAHGFRSGVVHGRGARPKEEAPLRERVEGAPT